MQVARIIAVSAGLLLFVSTAYGRAPTAAECAADGYHVIQGTNGADILIGTPGNDCIFGHGGNDSIRARGGNDIIVGGDGIDFIWAGRGNDSVWGGQGADRIWGQAGSDTLRGNRGNDYIVGGIGDDTIRGGAGNDTIRGARGDDRIRGGRGGDIIFGGGGNDWIRGQGGADHLNGGSGSDIVSGGRGADMLRGGTGDDIIKGNRGSDVIMGGRGNDDLRGGRGADQIFGGVGDDLIRGGRHGDDLYGGRGHDTIYGGHGHDYLVGNLGNDTLNGGNGSDTLEGGAGDDHLDGGNGDDTLDGGPNYDVCRNGTSYHSCEDDGTPDVAVTATACDDGVAPFPVAASGDGWALIGGPFGCMYEHNYPGKATFKAYFRDELLKASAGTDRNVLGFFGAYDSGDLKGINWLLSELANEGHIGQFDGMDISAGAPLDLTPADLAGVDVVILDAAPDAPQADFFVLTDQAMATLTQFQADGGVIVGSAYILVHWTNYYKWETKLANQQLTALFGGVTVDRGAQGPFAGNFSHKACRADNGAEVLSLTAVHTHLPKSNNPWFHAFWKLKIP